jgi:predicted dehydrogenase
MIDTSSTASHMHGNAKLKAAIVGCGMIAGGYDEVESAGLVRTHALSYRLNQHTELVAVADVDADKAQKFASRWTVDSWYQDASSLLEEQTPDLVSICTPDHNHAQILNLCLNSESVQGVWCEKPLTTDLDLVKRLVSEFSEAGKSLIVNYPRSHLPSMKQLKVQLVTGQLGVIQKVVVYYTKGILHNGSHAIDLLVNWWGKPSKIRVLSSFVDFTEEDPTIDALLEFKTVPVYLMGLNDSCYSQFEIDVFGSSGRASITHGGRLLVMRSIDPVIGPGGNKYLSEVADETETESGRAVAMVLDALVQAIKSGALLNQGDQIVDVMEICDELARQGRVLGEKVE